MIRDEKAGDRSGVRTVNELAFGQPGEAILVEELHRHGAAVVALVAESAESIVGHILFSPVQIEVTNDKRLLGLAPLSVLPIYQRQGIGSGLVDEGLKRCAALGWDGIVVLGHPEYYPRFGFVPAASFGLRCEYDVPTDVFMARELPGHAISGAKGLVRYHRAFAQL